MEVLNFCFSVLIFFSFFAINYFSFIALSPGGANKSDACGEVHARKEEENYFPKKEVFLSLFRGHSNNT